MKDANTIRTVRFWRQCTWSRLFFVRNRENSNIQSIVAIATEGKHIRPVNYILYMYKELGVLLKINPKKPNASASQAIRSPKNNHKITLWWERIYLVATLPSATRGTKGLEQLNVASNLKLQPPLLIHLNEFLLNLKMLFHFLLESMECYTICIFSYKS